MELITYIPIKFLENILTGGKDMTRKLNSKRAVWLRNSTSCFNFDKCRLSGIFLCMILQNLKKSLNAWLSYMRFNFFYTYI